MQPYLTVEAQEQIEEKFRLEREAIQILDVVVAEWDSDPQSVQCFDLRIVNRAKDIVSRLKELGDV